MRARLSLVTGFLVLLALWEGLVDRRLVSSFLFPAPSEIAAALVKGLFEGSLPTHLLATVRRLFLGCLFGGGLALVLGFGVGLSRRLGRFVEPIVAALHPMPKIALYPFLMVLLGIGETSLLVVPALSAFFPMFVNTASGVRQIRPVYFDLLRTCGGRRLDVVRHVALPGSLPNMLAGARISLNSAFVMTIGIEMLSAQTGLGSQLWLSRETLRLDAMWSLLFLISALGAGLTLAVHQLGAAIAPWAEPAE